MAWFFGNQITLLRALNETGASGLSAAYVNRHFRGVKTLYPNDFEQWSVERYCQFLFAYNLITQTEGQFHITAYGVEFLVWMTRTRRPSNRWF